MTINKAIAVSLLPFLGACVGMSDEIPNSQYEIDRLTHRDFKVEPFHRVHVDVNARVIITEGTNRHLTIATDPAHFDHILVDVHDGELILEHEGRHSEDYKTYINIIVPRLDAVNIDAVTWASIEDIEAVDFQMDFDGIGDVELTGSCINGWFNVDGIGDMDASDFVCQHVVAQFDGIGSIHLHATGTLELDADGIGDVSVDGNPRVKKASISGIGSTDID